MVAKKRVAVVGYGRVGRAAVEAIKVAPDFELAGLIRREASLKKPYPRDLQDIPISTRVEDLGRVETVLLCIPSREVPRIAVHYLAKGINTVDCFDIHGEEMLKLYSTLKKEARRNGVVAIIGAGWDPGVDSMIRGILEFMAPNGVTYVNWGPGMSMGHTVAAKAIEGVRDAVSLTLPVGYGKHRRLVYVKADKGANHDGIRKKILTDPYFVADDTEVRFVEDVSVFCDMGHGVRIERFGCSGVTYNQWFNFNMRINNPALTGQIMVAAARAGFKREPGAYTLLELPVIDFLTGMKTSLIERLT